MAFHSLKPTWVTGSQASPLSAFSHTICWEQPGSWYLTVLISSAQSHSFRTSMVCSHVSELFSWHCVWDCWGYTWRWNCSVVEVCRCRGFLFGNLWLHLLKWQYQVTFPQRCVSTYSILSWMAPVFHPFHFTFIPSCVVMPYSSCNLG